MSKSVSYSVVPRKNPQEPGKGADSEDKYDVSMINKARINFRPGLALSGMLTALSFSKVNKLPKKEEKKPEEEVSGVNEG